MLLTPLKTQVDRHIEARNGITSHFNKEMEKILNENSSKDKYWILGKVKTQRKGNKDVVKPFLQACDEKPSFVKESFVYEVDNKRGCKTLLWVMHPGDVIRFPTLNKTLYVSSDKKGTKILQPKIG